MRRFILIPAIILLMFLVTIPGLTANFDWTGNIDSDWNKLSNWLMDGSTTTLLPSSGDDVFIQTTTNPPILTSPDIVINNLTIDGSGSILTVSADPFTVFGDINLISNGELRHNIMGNITCGGNWDDYSGKFCPSSGVVVMNGTAATINQSSTNWFYNLDISPTATGVCTVANRLSVQRNLFINPTGELILPSGGLSYNVQGIINISGRLSFQDCTLWTYDDINVGSTGTLDIGNNGCLYLSSSVFVNSGGKFNAFGVDICTSTPGVYYNINIYGIVNWDDVIIKSCAGTFISPTATISQIREVDFLNSDGSSTTAHLAIDRTGNTNENFSFELINFDDTKGYNCHLIGDTTISVTFVNSGGYVGDMYELEENGAVINWTTGPSIQITFPIDSTTYDTLIGYIQGTTTGPVDSVEISIMNTFDSSYWDGFMWNSSTDTWFNPVGISSWTLDTTSVNWQSGYTYQITAWAEVMVGTETVSNFDEVYFTYDSSTYDPYMIIVDKQGGGDYTSIQPAIDAANPGDVIRVHAGVYHENIIMKHGVDLIGDGPDVTAIDGGGSGSVVIAADAAIKGFAIVNGNGSSRGLYKVGGGIYCDGTSPFIKNCVIANNIIQHNQNAYGGGICIYGGSPQIINCTIVDNDVYSTYNSCGGAIYSNSSFVLVNTIIAFNTGEAPNSHVGGIYCTNSGISNDYNLIFDNQPVQNQGYPAASTDMFIDPLFVDGTNGDFHLMVNSPCIDAGDPALQDIDGSRSDIGALPFITGTTPQLESINGAVTKIDGTPITGVIVTALQSDSIIATTASETDGSFEIEEIPAGWYELEASWSVNDITSSVRQLTHTGSIYLHFTLAIDYELAVIEGDVGGVDTYATSSCPSRLRSKSLSPKARLAFVELQKNENVIVRVAVDVSGHYQIPNLLPGTYTARAYNGRIYSNSKTIKIKEGQRLSIDFSFPLDLKESSVYNYPNPACEGYTTIRYSCANPNHRAKVRIFTISGELVREIKNSEIDGSQAPVYEYRWDLENDRGRGVSSGIYLYILELEEKSSGEKEQVTKKLAIVK